MMGKRFPDLFGRAGNGSIHKWVIWTDGPWICVEFGLADGKRMTTRKKAEAKSIGRSNETTPAEQAILEAESQWKVKIDKGYKQSAKDAAEGTVFLPMLAKGFDKHGHKINYPCSVQPKLDGLRCMAFWDGDEIRLMSRRGKDFNIPHLSAELGKILPEGLVLDGELYAHGESFQTITSWIKRLQDETAQIRYHVYDCFLRNQTEMPYKDRFELLANWFNKKQPVSIDFVDTYEVNSADEVYEMQSEFCSQGYEGAIVRENSGPYKLKHRSADLLKVKSFQDDEFEVIGWRRGLGRFHKCAIFRCVTESGREFDCICKGTMEQRAEQLANAQSYIGQWLKIKFFELTDEGVPRFPVGLGFRLPEDMDLPPPSKRRNRASNINDPAPVDVIEFPNGWRSKK